MKDKLEQLYISACIGQWDAETFANKAMELIEPLDSLTTVVNEHITQNLK